ncbi:MAG: hypothetical protein GWN84_19870 [Gammaproteobacteria bacterium]|nr:hypothetical protein [Gammaproteobacteria bacterium]NIR85080.1 hypothetical protein [Gammaproteobacteria bacterium]
MRRGLAALLVLLAPAWMAGAHAAAGESAPERLVLRIDAREWQRADGRTRVRLEATVLEVRASATGVRKGERLRIEYLRGGADALADSEALERRTRHGWQDTGGAAPVPPEQGAVVLARLRAAGDDGGAGRYGLAVGARSLERIDWSETPVAGRYARAHSVRYLAAEGTWAQADVHDTLRLTQAGEGRWQFEFKLIAPNFHQCAMDGIAERRDHFLEHREMIEEIGQECVLRLRYTARTVMLEDVGRHCRNWYCGMRGHIDGVRLEREGPGGGSR